jgi:hypothetical protein
MFKELVEGKVAQSSTETGPGKKLGGIEAENNFF